MVSSKRASTLALVSLTALALNLSVVARGDSDLANEDTVGEYRKWQEFKEFQEFQAWKRAKEAKRKNYWDDQKRFDKKKGYKGSWGGWKDERDPPPIDQAALMARYIVNQAGWTSVATVSSRKDTLNYPFVNVISFSDGPLGNGTGIPYLFLTPLDFTAQDVFKDNRATLMMTLAQGRWCEKKNYDPMDPRCARVVMSGKIKAVKEDNPEFPTARNAVFGRHPWLAHMPADHHFFFAKLKIGTIAVLDTFGGPKYVTIDDYLNPPNTDSLNDYMTRYQNKETDFLETEIDIQSSDFWLL